METAKATGSREDFRPNPKPRLREVMRFKQFSLRTEEGYWLWIRQFILFHGKRHPREMRKLEIKAFLSQHPSKWCPVFGGLEVGISPPHFRQTWNL